MMKKLINNGWFWCAVACYGGLWFSGYITHKTVVYFLGYIAGVTAVNLSMLCNK